MINSTIRAKIRKIKVHTKRVMQSSLSGDYLSAFKGSGLEFDQLRDYQMGDDIRFIDWNSSAKMNKIMVKQFIEERDRTVIIAIDVSASSRYASQEELRKDSIAQVATALAFIAEENKDKVGALFFSDRIEKWIPPSRGPLHVGSLLETIFSLEPKGTGTNFNEALRFLINAKKRNAIVFMLSDWINNANDYSKLLKVASVEYDFIGMRFQDPCETNFPDIGLLEVHDPETGAIFTLDTRKKRQEVSPLNLFINKEWRLQKEMFSKYNIDLLDFIIGRPFINPLIRFFHQRIRRQI
ncbi:DUF58 domain-containing protein [Candidatus Babeliales bacterium]|nr:DUF58 domain-containing protein [Candidatus Babeliales bacterium]